MLNKTNKEMKKVRAAIVGYGNIGHYVLEALQAAPDFEIAGVVRRAGAENKPAELNDYAVVKDIKELQGVDVAILCTPTRSVESYAKEILALGINTVTRCLCQRARGCIHHFGRMGSGKRFDCTYLTGGDCAQRNHLYKFRPRHEHGTYGSRKSH